MSRTLRPLHHVTLLCSVLLASALGCSTKKEKEAPIAPPPPRGAASLDQLTIGLGVAKGLDATLASPSTRFEHVWVLDEKRAILAGGVPGGEAVALITLDAGKTWRSIHTDRETWSTWTLGEEGAFLLALGPKETTLDAPPAFGKKAPPPPPFQLFFASLDSPSFGTATNVDQPPLARRPDPKQPIPHPRLAMLDRETASLVVEPKPKKFFARYAAMPGVDPPAEVELPKQETFATVPLGRPAKLFSVKGRELLSRKWPVSGQPVPAGTPESAVKVTPTVLAELSKEPICETGTLSVSAITQPPSKQSPNKRYLFVVFPDKVSLVPMPAEALEGGAFGCGDSKFVVEAPDAEDKTSITLLLCDLDGKCTTPTRAVFKPWLEKHDREIVVTPTATGAAAVMSAKAGERWGVYYAQSTDGGKFYERARVIGEGTGARGRIDFGALVSLGKRTLLLVSADVTGTSRRGFYVIVSDDDGATWNPP